VRAGAPDPAADAESRDAFRRTVLGFTDLVGDINVERFSYWTFPPAIDLRCRLKITDTGWRFENVRAKYCGGHVNAEAAIDYRDEGRQFRMKCEIVGARLEEFTRHIKYSVTPGRVNGRLILNVTSEGLKGLHGSAEIHVRQAELGTLPVILKAFTFLSFPGIEKEELSQVDGIMTLTPRAIVFQSLSMRSRSGSFCLEADRLGSVSYDGKLDLRFKPVIPSRILKNVPVVGEAADLIISGLQQGIMRVRVTGTLSEPSFQWTPFR
jgi:hypothetical protein